MPVQQDALFAQQDRSDADADADADADGRMCGWDLGAPGQTGGARRYVGQAPGADELLDDGGVLVWVRQQVDGLDAEAVLGEQVLPQLFPVKSAR
ncbi:hypothetical protein ACH4EC_05655 [Streptomyces anulatus]